MGNSKKEAEKGRSVREVGREIIELEERVNIIMDVSTWFPPFVFALFLGTMSTRILVKALFSFGASISWERGFNCHGTVPRRQWHD